MAVITFFMCFAYRRSDHMWETETLKTWAQANTEWRLKEKQGEPKESDKTRTKSILITKTFWEFFAISWAGNLFLLWVCAIMQNVTVGDAISKGYKKCWYFTTKYLTRKFLWALYNLSLPLTSFSLRWRLIASAKPRVNTADPMLLFLPIPALRHSNGRNKTCFRRLIIGK